MKHNGDDSYPSSVEKLFSDDEELSVEELPQPEDEGLEEHRDPKTINGSLLLFDSSSDDEDQDHDKDEDDSVTRMLLEDAKNYPLIESEDETEERSDEENCRHL